MVVSGSRILGFKCFSHVDSHINMIHDDFMGFLKKVNSLNVSQNSLLYRDIRYVPPKNCFYSANIVIRAQLSLSKSIALHYVLYSFSSMAISIPSTLCLLSGQSLLAHQNSEENFSQTYFDVGNVFGQQSFANSSNSKHLFDTVLKFAHLVIF